MGGGMNMGMALLTDVAGSVIVKMLSPGSIDVKASGSCAWQAVSTADWLQLKSEVNAAGTVSVVYTAAPGLNARRQAVIVIQPVAGMPPLKGQTVVVVGRQ